MRDLESFYELHKDSIMKLAQRNGKHLQDGTLVAARSDPWMMEPPEHTESRRSDDQREYRRAIY